MNIYLIDDDPIYRFTFEVNFKRLGDQYKLKCFGDGEEAIIFIKDQMSNAIELPDIVFLDINMPIMDGWDFMDEFVEIKSNLAKLPLIYMVSSSVDQKDVDKSKTYSEITDYLVKPVTMVKINELITSLDEA